MSARNSLLIAGGYTAAALLVAVIAFATFSYYRETAGNRLAASGEEGGAQQASGARRVVVKPPVPAVNAAALTRARAQLGQLQTMLERNSRLLEKRTTLLNQKTSECKALQQQLDGSIATVLALLDMDPEGSDDRAARESLGRNLEAEFARLKAELEQSESLEIEQMQQVVSLKTELEETKSEIASIREQADAELLLMLEQQQLLEATSRRAFVRLGAAAVPVLVEFLDDDRADVRCWAASILGDLGAAGQDAGPALMGLLVDPDEMVREEARLALERLAN